MTHDELAKALGVHPRTLLRLFNAGMPKPKRRESESAWLKRARAWRVENKRKPGREPDPVDPDEVSATTRYRNAKAELAELDLAKKRGELHSQAECERAFVTRCAELRAAFAQLPDRLARRLYQAPTPDAIKLQVEEELRRCFEILVGS